MQACGTPSLITESTRTPLRSLQSRGRMESFIPSGPERKHRGEADESNTRACVHARMRARTEFD